MPRVEGSTSDLLPGSACKHKVLFFGSGGYYLICSECGTMWVAKDPFSHDDRPDANFKPSSLNTDDRRVEPAMSDTIKASDEGLDNEEDRDLEPGEPNAAQRAAAALRETCGQRPQGHDKVFSQYVLLSNPPVYSWICRHCGEEGQDRGILGSTDEYFDVRRKFGKA